MGTHIEKKWARNKLVFGERGLFRNPRFLSTEHRTGCLQLQFYVVTILCHPEDTGLAGELRTVRHLKAGLDTHFVSVAPPSQ